MCDAITRDQRMLVRAYTRQFIFSHSLALSPFISPLLSDHIYTVAGKNILDIFDRSLKKNYQILIISD